MQTLKDAKRIVVKVGTSTLTYGTGMINIQGIEKLVKVLSDIKNSGREVMLVSSGAIGAGIGRLKLRERPTDTHSKKAAAAVGQCQLMHTYDKLFSEYNHTVAQVLLTKTITDREETKNNVVNTIERLIEYGCIPIVNENDTVAVDDLEFGDNDTLSAIVATLCKADALILLSDIDGLYTGDPRSDKTAELIPCVNEITDELKALAGGSGTARGTGGMITKLCAAEMAMKNGITMAIINGDTPQRIYDLLDGKDVGTIFVGK